MATWIITEMERNASDGGVTAVYWTCTHTDGDDSVSNCGLVGFLPDASADGFIAFDSLDEATVIAWVHGSVDKEGIEASLIDKMAEVKTPSTLNGLAW